MILLLAATAVGLVALFGAGAASATVLCKSATEHCAASSTYGKGTIVEASLKSGTKWTLNAGYKTFECEEASIKGEVTDPGGPTSSAVSGPVTTLSVGKCNGTVEIAKSGTFKIIYTSGGSGTLTLEGLEISTLSGGFCSYGGPVSTSLTGGAMAGIKASASSVPFIGGFATCAKPATLSAEYTVTKPEPLYVERERTAAVLCKSATFPCSGGTYGPGSTVQLSLKTELFTFSGGGGGITYNACGEVTIDGEVTSKVETGVDVSGKVTKFSLAACLAKVTVLELGSFSISYSSGNDGFLTLEGFKLEDGVYACSHTGPVTMSLQAGAPGTAILNFPLLNKDGICPNPLKWKAVLAVEAPSPLYVSEL